MMKKILLFVVPLAAVAITSFAQVQRRNTQGQRISLTVKDSITADPRDTVLGHPSVTRHDLSVDGRIIHYTATAGYMPMKDKDDKLLAKIFYVAYEADNQEKGKRPVTFVFNGGPGSASIWLHMGSFGPVRVQFGDDKGNASAPPYHYSDNPYTWLGFTDLVFIDPVSTGYSRSAKGVDVNQFHGYTEDLASVGDFIRLYVTKNSRWSSPKFIAGESYGTTRAAGLSGYLQSQYGMYLNGITLISSVLNFQLIDFNHGNEMPYQFFLPTYAATAQYHHKLSAPLQSLSTEELVKRAELFTMGTYAYFLGEGDTASPELTNKVVDTLNYFTGISKEYIRRANERITDFRFFKEVLRNDGKIVGRYDSRFTGEDIDDAGEYPSYDPSDANLNGLFISTFNNYVRNDLGYKNDIPYEAVTNVRPWDYKPAINSYLDVSETLRSAMTENPHLKVNVVCGYYDLATPVYNAEYVVNHMGLKSDVRKNIILNYYKAGHMVYVSKETDAKLKSDEEKFYRDALNQ
ncbi:S10 family peptidase [Mucilaginibacter sp. UYCu711]|uniref:S10 family peptidase n=1 Tax=Mucilaginibacter sp. UYCu711 TaxID=3156339 RepID=UPI003D204BE4